MKLLTFTTDFGIKSNYVAQMKAVVLSLTDTKIVDINHEITPQNILEGAFVLYTSVAYFPIGTVHVVVVDPGVGSDRRGIVITTPTQILVGPDNGLLIPTAKKLGNFTVYEIKNTQFFEDKISNTFHGRDIFTPVAAHILNGCLFSDIGPIINDYKTIDFGKSEIAEKTATGKILHIDSFGNIITNISGSEINKHLNFDQKIMSFIGKKHFKIPFVKTYVDVKKDELLATIGSSDFLEISQNQGDAAKKIKAKVGDEIKILFS